MNPIIERLKEYKAKYHLTVDEVADNLGCSSSIISSWLRGVRSPKPKNMVAIIEMINQPPKARITIPARILIRISRYYPELVPVVAELIKMDNTTQVAPLERGLAQKILAKPQEELAIWKISELYALKQVSMGKDYNSD